MRLPITRQSITYQQHVIFICAHRPENWSIKTLLACALSGAMNSLELWTCTPTGTNTICVSLYVSFATLVHNPLANSHVPLCPMFSKYFCAFGVADWFIMVLIQAVLNLGEICSFLALDHSGQLPKSDSSSCTSWLGINCKKWSSESLSIFSVLMCMPAGV